MMLKLLHVSRSTPISILNSSRAKTLTAKKKNNKNKTVNVALCFLCDVNLIVCRHALNNVSLLHYLIVRPVDEQD